MGNISRRKFIKNATILAAGGTAIPVFSFAKKLSAFSAGKTSSFLLIPPFLGRSTDSSISINIVAGEQDVTSFIRFRRYEGSAGTGWQQTEQKSIDAFSPAEVTLAPLTAGTFYQYQLFARERTGGQFQMVKEKTFRTRRSGPCSFSFAVISDSHITPSNRERLGVLSQISGSVLSRKPDFTFMLGDNIQTFASHGGPMKEEWDGPMLYSLLRSGLAELPSSVPIFAVIGNWEGENGWHPARERGWARKARMAWIPNPGPHTYPEGGSEDEDFYGFTWGDVLCLALNVTGYTRSDHTILSAVGKADDWSLGERQSEWLYEQLSRSRAKWKLLFIHHPVGGNAGDDVNSRYGRGGGRAAKTGEQALVHSWMKEFGVQALFYGHDHVFTDIPVDGAHYVCVGSAGAPWKFPESVTGYKRYWTPSGYTWVDVSEKKLTISFISPDRLEPEGKVLHAFEIRAK